MAHQQRVENMRDNATAYRVAHGAINSAKHFLANATDALADPHPDRLDALDFMDAAQKQMDKARKVIRNTLPVSVATTER